MGVASIRSDKNAEIDSFGLVALCSIGPILSVLILSFFYPGESTEIVSEIVGSYSDTVELGFAYFKAIPEYMLEVFKALAPILVIFLLFQKFAFHLGKEAFLKILVGIVFTYVGLVIPVYALIGWFVVSAEPAVHVLTVQVEEVSAGAVTKKEMLRSLQFAIALAMALSMIRVLTGISILWLVVPGYGIALALSFFTPPIFTAIAFDSGGVASGPMSATFMLPFAIGVCKAVGGNVLTDAFGTVALVAMMPLITVQLMGLKSVMSQKSAGEEFAAHYADTEVIELWEVQ